MFGQVGNREVNSGARVRGQQQLGWHHMAEAVAGILYISFRSSRVWSSILCVQRCSSLVDFSLSANNKSPELQISQGKSPLPKKARASPFPTQLQRSWGWSAWLGAAASSEVTWLLCSPLLSHCWCSQNGHGAPLARALVSVCFFHMQESLSAASSSQGIHTSTADTHSGPARHPRAKQPWNSSWLCPHLPLSTGQQQGADQQPQGQQEPGAVRGRVRSEGAAPCPTLQAAVQSILTCSLSQEESRSAASALSRLYSKGEPTHITGDIHTLGHWTDRLWKNVL